MNETPAESAALRRAGKPPSVPADSNVRFMLVKLPPLKDNPQFPQTVTLVLEAPDGQPTRFFSRTKERRDGLG